MLLINGVEYSHEVSVKIGGNAFQLFGQNVKVIAISQPSDKFLDYQMDPEEDSFRLTDDASYESFGTLGVDATKLRVSWLAFELTSYVLAYIVLAKILESQLVMLGE